MVVSKARPFRFSRAVTIAGAVAVVAACGGGGGDGGAASSSAASTATSSAESDEPATTEELTAALLPAEAFGPNANVVTISVQEITTATGGGLPPGATVEPATCAENLGSTQFSPDDFGAVVAQSATSAETVTVEVLAEGEQLDASMPGFEGVPAECAQVTVTAPDGSTATVSFAPLDVPALGDASGGMTLTTALTRPDGTNVTVPALIAAAVDGQRMVFLQQVSANAAPLDEAAFIGLFEEAFETQQAD